MMRVHSTSARLFWAGLFIKCWAIVVWTPSIQVAWFVPFVQHCLLSPSLDPWSSFLVSGGAPEAFPYGLIMLLVHLPFVWLGSVLDSVLGAGQLYAQMGFGFSLLSIDILLLWQLNRSFENQSKALLIAYWCSPIVFFISYWHGQTDLLPVFFLTASLLALKDNRLRTCAWMLGLAIGAKLTAALVVPFYAVYLWRNRRYHHALKIMSADLMLSILLTQWPTLRSSGAWVMMYQNPQLNRLYDITIAFGDTHSLFVLPIFLAGLLYACWEVKRMNPPILFAFLGSLFFTLILLSGAPVGWYLWVVPFLTLYYLAADPLKRVLVLAFNALFILHFLPITEGSIDKTLPALSQHAMILSGLVATGALLAMNMMQKAFRDNDFVRLTRAPLSVGIAGDSGTGKDTLARAVAQLFGSHRVSALSGDDYHRYERHHGAYQSLTHLHPNANYLQDFAKDALKLLSGQTVDCREYDHLTGRFFPSKPLPAKDVIVISGLHALSCAPVCNKLSVRVFLSMDESLRLHFKMMRDVHQRGHNPEQVLASIAARQADYAQYIAPQEKTTELHFHLSADRPKVTHNNLRLTATVPGGFPSEALARTLMATAGLGCTIGTYNTEQVLHFACQPLSASVIERMAHARVPTLTQYLSLRPEWADNTLGLMQLILLIQLDQDKE